MTARTLAAALAGIVGAVLAVRLLYGPFSLPGIPVNTAMNPAGVFGLLVTVLIVTAAAGRERLPSRSYKWMLGLVAITVLGFAAGMRVGLLSDDFAMLQITVEWSPAHFWADFRTPGGDGFWRPVGLASLGLNQLAIARDAALWHVSTLILHTANAAMVGMLAMRLGAGSTGTFFAATLFAIHGGRPESAVWLSSRFDVQALFFALLAALLWERGRHVWGVAAFALAAMSKEAVYVLPAVLVCLSFYGKRSWKTTIPYFAAGALLFAYRWTLFRGIGGYHVDGQAQFYSFNLTTVKTLLVRLWTGLYLPINWSAEPAWWLAAAAVVYLTAMLYLGWRAQPTRPLWPILAALLVAVFPALHLLSAGADLEGQRLFYFPSVFFCLLLALAIEGMMPRVQWTIVTAVLLFHLGALQHNLVEWRYVSTKAAAVCAEAARYPSVHLTGLPRTIRGVQAFVNGTDECVRMAAGRPIQVTTEGPPPEGAVHLQWDGSREQVRHVAP